MLLASVNSNVAFHSSNMHVPPWPCRPQLFCGIVLHLIVLEQGFTLIATEEVLAVIFGAMPQEEAATAAILVPRGSGIEQRPRG